MNPNEPPVPPQLPSPPPPEGPPPAGELPVAYWKQQVPPEPPLPERLDLKILFEALLRRPHALVERLGRQDHHATGKFLLIGLVSLLLFGFVLGCFAKGGQLWAAPLKVTAGLAFSGLICFPSLYIFATLAGARTSVSQLAACLAGALALAGLLLLGFAPAMWIFAESTDSLGFMGWLSVLAWIIAVVFAFRFLKTAVMATGGTQVGPLTVWSIIFLLVTLQMTTTLRPILGRSQRLITQEKKFFLQHWAETMDKSLPSESASAKPSATRGTSSPE